MPPDSGKFVGRAGHKLDAALSSFGLDVAGWTCADFGCNVGGFTHCLLARGAARVYAVDTGYGFLAWQLRKDPRVTVMERTNALYAPAREPVDLVVIDVAWTPQRLIVPAGRNWLKPGGIILSLLKPHYELAKLQHGKPHAPLSPEKSHEVCLEVCRQLADLACPVHAVMPSALIGKGGNVEYVLLIRPSGPSGPVGPRTGPEMTKT